MVTLLKIDEPSGDGRNGRPPGGQSGWALWALGFRPFYLVASIFAALSVPLWVLQFNGLLGSVPPPGWHAQEMIFGYTLAIVVGFLFTAGRNWTGQPTPSGRQLQALVGLWVAARIMAYGPWPALTLALNLAFVWAAAAALARALVAAGNRRNYFFVAVLVALGLAQLLVQAALSGWLALPQALGLQAGLDLVLFVMAVMGGRVIPMFSNNGAPGTDAQRLPWVERLALGSVLAMLLLDVAPAPAPLKAAVLALAALAHAARLALWHPWRTRRVPLVWVLHVAYAWIVVHLALRCLATLGLGPSGSATHALTVGAIGTLTLGMMTRTARGHLGRPLRADRPEVAMYALITGAAIARVLLPLAEAAWTLPAIWISGLLWAAAFGTYAWVYGPWLCRPRIDGKPG